MSELPVSNSQAMALVRELARRVHGLAGDMQSLGYETDGAPLDDELSAAMQDALRGFGTLDGVIVARRNRHVAGQVRKLLDAIPVEGLKLHFGAGGIHLPGWINVDAPPAQLSLNVVRGIPLPDGLATHVFASHLLEHLYYPVEASHFVAECRRLLRDGGRMRLIVPDIEACLRAYADRDAEFFRRRREQWPGWPQGRTMLEDFLAYAGAFPDPAAFFEAHKYGYDFETLEKLLRKCGFAQVRRCSYMGSEDAELRIDDRSTVASATHDAGHFSIFVEAC